MNRSKLTTALGLTCVLALSTTVASAATYTVDPTHSSALFKVKHFETANFYGAFKKVTGTISYDAASPGDASISIAIDATSVDSRNEQRDGHIKSPDFLNAAEFPEITFESSSVVASGEDTFDVTGTLTMLGISKEITVSAEKTGAGAGRGGSQLIGFETMFIVDRTEFNMNFMAGPLSTDVKFLLALEAKMD